MPGAVTESDQLQQFIGALAALGPVQLGKAKRKHDVFESREVLKQVKRLKDEPNLEAAQLNDPASSQSRDIGSLNAYSTRGGTKQPSDDRQQRTLRTLARARRTRNGNELAGVNGKVDPGECPDHAVRRDEVFAHILHHYGRLYTQKRLTPFTLMRLSQVSSKRR